MPLSTNLAELTRRDGAEKKRTVLVALTYEMRCFNMSPGTSTKLLQDNCIPARRRCCMNCTCLSISFNVYYTTCAGVNRMIIYTPLTTHEQDRLQRGKHPLEGGHAFDVALGANRLRWSRNAMGLQLHCTQQSKSTYSTSLGLCLLCCESSCGYLSTA